MNGDALLREARRLASVRTRFLVTDHARTREPGKGRFPLSDRALVNCINAVGARVTEGPVADLREPGGWNRAIG